MLFENKKKYNKKKVQTLTRSETLGWEVANWKCVCVYVCVCAHLWNLCVCVCVYTCVCVHMCVCVYIHIDTLVFEYQLGIAHLCVYIHIDTLVFESVCVYTHRHTGFWKRISLVLHIFWLFYFSPFLYMFGESISLEKVSPGACGSSESVCACLCLYVASNADVCWRMLTVMLTYADERAAAIDYNTIYIYIYIYIYVCI